MSKQLDLFGEEVNEVKHRRREDVINDYDGFVEKFKPKKTTDDCYTPEPVYSALVKYIDENGGELSEEDIEAGKAFRTLVYTKADEEVLAGSSQRDESIGEMETRREYSYGLKLLEDTDNSFAGAEAVIDISTYAIQHRNREASGEWISIVEER